jgi:hypothetical protein
MKILRNLFVATAMLVTFVSCDTTDALLATDTTIDKDGNEVETKYDATISIIEGSSESKTEATVNMVDGKTTAKVRVTFTSEEGRFRRLYITENVGGEGAHPYTLQLGQDAEGKDIKVDLKGDKSIDLESKLKKGFDFAFNITPEQLKEGSVEYKFWATNNRGDFRNPDFKGNLGGVRRVAEIGTITLKFGTEANATKMKSFEAVLLSAPLANGKSETFVSLFDGKTYKINEGIEMSSFWDFGYFYGNTGKACLYGTNNYPESGFASEFSNIIKDNNLNTTKFRLSTRTADFFNDVTATQLEDITASNNSVKKLNVGDIIEFVDNYGKKGLIKVLSITAGAGSNGRIKIHIKMQA